MAILIGLAMLGGFVLSGSVSRHAIDLRAGAWVPVWLAGLAVLSYLSTYQGIGVIGLGWGFLVNLFFSAAIYALATAMRLRRDRVLRIIEDTPHDEVEARA